MRRSMMLTVALAAGLLWHSGNASPVSAEGAEGGGGPPASVVAAWQNGEVPAPPQESPGRGRIRGFGPPQWVRAAWQNGESPIAPEWVFDFRASLGMNVFGPPPGVFDAQASPEMVDGKGQPGLEQPGFGPPDWVLDAWLHGEGFDLPGVDLPGDGRHAN